MNLALTPIRFLYRAMDVFSNKTGVICGAKTFTYGQFGERCERLASGLKRLGVLPGDRVAYLSFNTHQLLEGYYGVVMAGAIVMPINVRLSLQELATVLNHSGARVLLFENDFAATVAQLKSACPFVEHYITLDAVIDVATMTSTKLIDSGEAEHVDWTRIDEDSVAELFYTSGSTGSPKGVALTHRNLYLHGLMVATIMSDPGNMIDLHTIPLFHANGWGRPQTSTFLGVTQIMVRRFEPVSVLKMIAQYKATDMSLVPTMANAILACPELGQHDGSSLRRILLGGAAASPSLVERLEKAFGCTVASGYGLSETSPVLTTALPKPGVEYTSNEDRWQKQALTGWPIIGAEVRVVDPEGADVPKDNESIGEIIARGDNIMQGYYREQEATDAVIRDGWFHTGDMAAWDGNGYLKIVDRKKEIIISGGENISSIEVEKAIYAHEGVLECAVVAAPDEKWGEVPVALIVRKDGASFSAEELMEFLGSRLGRFKLPRQIHFETEALPKTGTGKIRKNILRERFWAGREKRIQG
ncbi:MAG: long-chain-fatty-acid--CoA ligase [Acidobacteria bacterium]|nr:long-chain-fatty-acid--CoA ligase [Acidobacteriota bacterium]